MMFKHRIALQAISLLTCGLLATVSQAQQGVASGYPNKPVTLVVPFAPGGGTDIGARIIADKLTRKWGQAVVVDNKGGSGGVIGANAVAQAKADGYTLLFANVGTQSINPALYKKLPYNADTAFVPVSLVAELPFFLLTRANFPAKNVRELVAYAKANPEKVTFASSGNGGSPHLSAEVFASMANIKMTHVPYKGGGPAMNDMMAGHVDILFASVLESVGHVKTGKLGALGVTTKVRSASAPEIPTISDSGVTELKGYESGSWLGVLAPAGTPPAIIQKITADIQDIMKQPDTIKAFNEQGAIAVGSSSAQFKTVIDTDLKRYTKIIQDKNIGID
jgi:tripartite-type tricarboxylate transporter receptor subunit TctC